METLTPIKTKTTTIDIELLGRPYRLTTSIECAESLTAASVRLHQLMLSLQQRHPDKSFDRILIMSAIELAKTSLSTNDLESFSSLGDKISEVLV